MLELTLHLLLSLIGKHFIVLVLLPEHLLLLHDHCMVLILFPVPQSGYHPTYFPIDVT